MILGNVAGLNVADGAKILDQMKDGSELKKAQTEVVHIQEQFTRMDTLLGATPQERKTQAPEFYQECYRQAYKEAGIQTMEFLIMGGCAAGFFIGAAMGGMNAIPFFGLIGAFWGGPAIMKGIANKWILPKKTDAKVEQNLRNEKARLQADLLRAQERLEKAKSKALTDVQQQAQNKDVQTIEEEPEFVVIDGIRLKKKKEGTLQHILDDISFGHSRK